MVLDGELMVPQGIFLYCLSDIVGFGLPTYPNVINRRLCLHRTLLLVIANFWNIHQISHNLDDLASFFVWGIRLGSKVLPSSHRHFSMNPLFIRSPCIISLLMSCYRLGL